MREYAAIALDNPENKVNIGSVPRASLGLLCGAWRCVLSSDLA
jgi:hypothetical protein